MIEKSVIKKFKSKKHNAYLVKGKEYAVKKVFSSDITLNKEAELLKLLDGVYAPSIIEKSENTLYLEYVEGLDLVELLLFGSKDTCAYLGALLSSFIKNFHYLTKGIILTDENLHHYILHEKKGLIRVDLEEYEKGSVNLWLSKLCAFSLLYDGISRDNLRAFLNALVKEFDIELTNIKKEILKEIDIILKRRNEYTSDYLFIFDSENN